MFDFDEYLVKEKGYFIPRSCFIVVITSYIVTGLIMLAVSIYQDVGSKTPQEIRTDPSPVRIVR